MKKMAVLGPEGTYCDVAANKYKNEYEIVYFPSILKTALALNEGMEAVLPFENTLDGFVMETLDNLINSGCQIIEQNKLPISFSFVSNKKINEVEEVFVQFKAYGQCIHFFSENNFKVNITESNMMSLEEILSKDGNVGAIVPTHTIQNYKFKCVIKDIADSIHNETRFIHIGKIKNSYLEHDLRASLALSSLEDKPGLLFSILDTFNNYNFNLKAILSRPRKDIIGKYIFYIEIELKDNDLTKFETLLEELNNSSEVKVQLLGIYNAI